MTGEMHRSSPRSATGARSRERHPISVQEQCYAAAKHLLAAGISFIPIATNRSKSLCCNLLPRVNDRATWKPFQKRLPTRRELADWYKPGRADQVCGIGIVCGAISGGLQVIDCDNWEIANRWFTRVGKANRLLRDKLILVETPRPGLHAYFRCEQVESSRKLARGTRPDPEMCEPELTTLIELKGERGYVIAPPSPARCHPSRKRYQYLTSRAIAEVETITAEERAILLAMAEELNEHRPPPASHPTVPMRSRRTTYGGPRPGDDFNARAAWSEILEPHGWTFVREDADGTQHWSRPGRSGSRAGATVNYAGSDRLYVFSTSAPPFEEDRGYSKFEAYALLNQGGDFRAAAQSLRGLGYGRSSCGNYGDPFAVYGQLPPSRSKR